ncbi:TIGR02221 family CRISPR-associated protein [Comamonas sp. SCN 65-56]|uniref:TIGR02221 family CRISPR-associated protein n=1 Tax=Comamonas sp. SCN 65-56 TaxID=1660095 RepID=UPI000B02B780|nr:TIGR02221 family CRISPR-associated protein [Comamonas sp. SCN 65-56]
MTTLISFLGKSRADASAGYRVANYRFAPNFARKVPFFGMALLEYAKPERLILVGTAGSMWDVFFDHQHTDDEATLVVSDAVDRATVTPELLRTHEEILTQRLGMPVQCLLIPYARDSAEQAAVLSELAVVLQPSEEIILDVTHGFRHLPMLALVAARYLTHVRGVRVQELYYGALEMTNAETGETPVLRLGAMLQMLDWVEALASYGQSGNYGVFADLFKTDGMPASHADQLAKGAYFERGSNPVQARQALGVAHKSLQSHHGAMSELFRQTLTDQIDWFRTGNRADWEFRLADRYLTRKDYLRAVIYLGDLNFEVQHSHMR